ANGWQLWGDTYDRGSRDIFEVQDEIARQISTALRLKLTGDQEQRLGKRYTENAEAYQAYLKGRYSWVKYTKAGLESAIEHFRKAIHLDPNYVLAYAGSVDCYLRLATNYIPPEDLVSQVEASNLATEMEDPDGGFGTSDETVRLRYEWDQKAAQREQKRAAESKSEYPAAHQWYAAYQFAINVHERTLSDAKSTQELESPVSERQPAFDSKCAHQYLYFNPTQAEEIQVLCAIAREQIDSGNYEAAGLVLQDWWNFGEWPKLEGLSQHLSADLLFTTGNLAGWLASARQAPLGQKHAEALLSGAIALFEQLGSRLRCADARIELAYCYFREGLFDLAASTLRVALNVLGEKDTELRSLGLVRLASIESRAGRLHDALSRLNEAGEIVKVGGPWATGRYLLELAITLKDLAVAEGRQDYFDQAIKHYKEARYEFEAIGNHRYNAIMENNHGYLLLRLGRFDEAETHLVRARKLFDSFADKVRRAQVDDTLALLYVAAERLELAEQSISRSVKMLEKGGEEALLAESLTTQGLVLCRLGRHREAKR
ncbi:MAG: tetratricopeptide repeat protein, partial [Pyrinomonadaceae bacterium]